MLNVLGSIPLITQDLCQRLLEWHVFNNHSAIVSTFRVTVDHIHPRLLLSASLVNPWSFLGYLSILLLISLILYWIFIPINDIRVSDAAFHLKEDFPDTSLERKFCTSH